jgi:hypothetical protein
MNEEGPSERWSTSSFIFSQKKTSSFISGVVEKERPAAAQRMHACTRSQKKGQGAYTYADRHERERIRCLLVALSRCPTQCKVMPLLHACWSRSLAAPPACLAVQSDGSLSLLLAARPLTCSFGIPCFPSLSLVRRARAENNPGRKYS